jgi:hypothetical protein
LDATRNLSRIHLLEVIQGSKGFALFVALTFRDTGNAIIILNEHLNLAQARAHKPSNLLVQGERPMLGFLLIMIPVRRNPIGEGIAGKTLQEIEGLGLAALEAPDDENGG